MKDWDAQFKLSDHFKLYEVEKSETAIARGIDNQLTSEDQIHRAAAFAHAILEPIREKFGSFSPNSWFRCEELEKALTWESGFKSWCSAHRMAYDVSSWGQYFERKQHPKVEACDIEIAGIDNKELFNWIKDNLEGEFDQLLIEGYHRGDPSSGWVHVSRRYDGPQRGFVGAIPNP